ncbi:alpha/beta fold hydrolase [Actinoalloteichus hymeniacidonis]|uniref:Hydrolase or acyltransferase of alpha/beta superfamily n=1 Tax=Actinoalloteichus hymeniacidonis TaxID=340345 RepID=A0AAC9MZR1_9PSEU|nr:alpha/beta hydrolase [Actinoalloteichus hymeniacidonis]AOS64635.1 putative hydrolase or acyltransferase of alpha/beta superfamily [Actinoalloteichus hymeniacidonis]MBB5907291.1 pimeloyl-ACP methyl ester carboxylesterase [Actinoalloteichus hymeniacidonis]
MAEVHYRTATVAGHRVFYREAGPSQAPTVVLLHGYPTSSHMFRELIPALADRYHVIAPDLLGFGQSDAPSVDEFDYSFDALADVTAELLDTLGITKFAMYVQDYGAPIGWRLALNAPERITAIISQSGNAYEAGFVEPFWAPIWAYAADPSPSNEAALRGALGLDAIRWQYLHGVADPSLVSPDTWTHDHALIQRPGNDAIQLRLFRDYITNVAGYPRLHEYFRESQVPLLAVWGANDEIFGPDGARAFAGDLPDAEIHLLDAGHFALESDFDTVTGYIRGFLGRVLE